MAGSTSDRAMLALRPAPPIATARASPDIDWADAALVIASTEMPIERDTVCFITTDTHEPGAVDEDCVIEDRVLMSRSSWPQF